MINFRLSVALLLTSLAGFMSSTARAASEGSAETSVIVGATLIDGNGGTPVKNSVIYVRDGKIERIVSAKKPRFPKSVKVIDAHGKFVIPGLVDSHSHIDSVGGIPLDAKQQAIVREYYPRAFLFNGVTTVLNMSAHQPDAVLALRDRVKTNPKLLVPRIYTGASHFTAEGGWGGRHKGGLTSLSEIGERLDAYKAAGFDLVKIINEEGLGHEGVFPRIPPEYLLEVTRVSREKNLPVFIHATDEDEYLQSISSAPRAMAHGIFTPQTADGPVIKGLKATNIFVVPTIVLFEAFYSFLDNPDQLEDPLLKASVPDFILKAMHDPAVQAQAYKNMDGILRMDSAAWARAAVPQLRANIKRFAQAGIPIAAGTDGGGAVVHSFQGYNLPRELEILADCCLTKMQTLIAASKTPARIMGQEAVFGTLEPGRSADLLILDADPLKDISAVRKFSRMLLRGNLIERSALTYEAYLAEKAAKR